MQPPANLSGTAFVTNVSRSRRQDLSQDRYAPWWVTDEAVRLYEELSREVYPHDDVSTSLRNRFYLEEMISYLAAHPGGGVLNLGAGFSNYSFLIGTASWLGEADLPEVMEFKSQQVHEWQRQGRLHEPPVHYVSCDLATEEGQDTLLDAVRLPLIGLPNFMMMEGLTYYLPRERFTGLVERLATIQRPGSLLAFETWSTDADSYPVYRRLLDYLARDFGGQGATYNLLDRADVEALPGYRLLKATDIEEQERRFTQDWAIQGRDLHLPIHFYVLERSVE